MTRAKPHIKFRFVRETGVHSAGGEMYRTCLFAPVEGTAHEVSISVTDEVAETLEPDVEYTLVRA